MSDAALDLRNPPIVEAVVDIECDFKPGQQLGVLEGAARLRLSDHYPEFRLQHLQEFQFHVDGGKPIEPVEQQGLQALQFLKQDGKQLVQLRATGYSFNRLAPYTSFDDYLPEIHRTWDVYRDIASPIQIKQVRLRYINRIPLPTTDGRVDLDEYIRLGPRLPDEQHLTFIGFLNQYVAVEAGTGYQVTVVLTAQRPDGDRMPVIFDNAASALRQANPEDWEWLKSTLGGLRALKNRVFKNTLSPECLNLFR